MHYKNGRIAVVGDRVIGKGYNYGLIAGTLLSITPGATTCNCMVGIVKVEAFGEHTQGQKIKEMYDLKHGTSGEKNNITYIEEYTTQCDYLLHVDDVIDYLAPHINIPVVEGGINAKD